MHRVPLSAPAMVLLTELRERSAAEDMWLFPSGDGHRQDVKKTWAAACKAARIKGARLHDARHTFASVLVSGGASLPLIGGLLGHASPVTTARYAHLFDDPLRLAAERAGAAISGAKAVEPVPLNKGSAA